MLYSNVELTKNEVERDWGKNYQFELGESGRGRKLLALPAFENQPDIKCGWNDLSIGLTKSGRPRIVNGNNDIYAIFSCAGIYTRGTYGTVSVSDLSAIEVIGRGNGAYGDAGRIGGWDDIVIKMNKPCLIKVRPVGGYKTNSKFYYFDGKEFYKSGDVDELRDNFDIEELWSSDWYMV